MPRVPELPRNATRADIEALQAAYGRRIVTASGFPFRSTWYEHPYLDSRGRLRSWEACERIARKAHRENLSLVGS